MKSQKVCLIAAISFIAVWSSSITAASCEIQYTRTACPGQEEISFKKCKGAASCSKIKTVDTIEQCRSKATKSCRNKRLTITQSKVINALFNGEQITTESGKSDFCLEYKNADKEFNHC